MKKIKIILYLMLVLILSFSTYGQESKETATKVEFQKLPKKVKERVNSMKGFEVKNSSYEFENNVKVFIVEIDNGKSTFDLKMDKNGKILGREEDYL